MARMIDLYTGNPITVDSLEPGVRVVCRKLLEMGAEPYASCDGHGVHANWYVSFYAPQEVAQAVVDRGYFEVKLLQSGEITGLRSAAGLGRWCMRLSRASLDHAADPADLSAWWAEK